MKVNEEPKALTYVVFDKKTGRIVHTHRRFDSEEGVYRECDPREVMNLVAADEFTLRHVTGADSKNLEVTVTTDMPVGGSLREGGFIVDVKSKKLLERPNIELSSEKTELEGDGKDSTLIQIKVIDKKGKVVERYNGTIKVITNRGKLSARGGLVKLKNGIGEITLTATNETVDRVNVLAQCLEGTCDLGHLVLQFV